MCSNRFIAAITFAGLSVCGAITVAQSGQPERPPGQSPPPNARQPGGPGERRGGEAPNVEASMKGMNRALGQLRDQLADATKKYACLKLIGDAQRGCINAKSGTPHQIQDMKEEAAKSKAAESYRRQLMAVARKLLDIEQNILEGKTDAAKALITEVLKMRDDGHTEFGVE